MWTENFKVFNIFIHNRKYRQAVSLQPGSSARFVVAENEPGAQGKSDQAGTALDGQGEFPHMGSCAVRSAGRRHVLPIEPGSHADLNRPRSDSGAA